MKRNVFVCLIFWLVSILAMELYGQGYVFGPNVRVSDYPPGGANGWPPNAGQRGVAVRGDTVYCVWSDDRAGRHNWFTKSIDGGQTFLPNVMVDDGVGAAFLPTLAVGDDVTIYVAWTDERPGFNYKQVYFSKSTDGGLTFTPDVLVNDTAGGIKNHPHRNPSMAVDSAGVIYIAYDDGRNGPGNYDIYFSKSTDGGFTFPNDVLVNDTIGDILNDTRPALALSKDSDIYISWNKAFQWLYVSKSTDGGISFSPDVQVNDTITESWTNSMDVDGRGYVHIVWKDGRDGNANIYYSRSTDGGLTFSPNIRVNDAAHEPEPQAYPSMCVDDSGVVYAVWEDGPATHPDIYFTLSTDKGDSAFVEPNVKVTDIPSDSGMFNPSIAVGNSGKVYVLWKDFRNDFWNGDIYFATGVVSGIEEEEPDHSPKTTEVRLFCHPNPFRDRVEIEYCIGQSAEGIELKVYDLTGRLIRSFPSSLLTLRSSVTWDGRDDNGEAVSAGVYLIKGEIGSKEVSEKVMYVR